MTVPYWTSVIVGALVVFWLISMYRQPVEHFATTATGAPSPPTPPPTPTPNAENALKNDYIETLALPGFPKQPDSGLAIYLTAFSDLVSYTQGAAIPPSTTPPRPTVYDGQLGLWRDMKTANNSFRLSVVDSSRGVIPAKLKTRNATGTPTDMGLSLTALRLVGPSSSAIGERVGSTAAYALTPFTAAFYGIIENVEFKDGEQRKVLFRITAEHPDKVEIAVRRRDNKNVLVEVMIGEAGRAYQWVVDKYMLMSNRLPTLYALTYDKGSKSSPVRAPSITLYIGKTKLTKTFTPSEAPAEIRLGNSEITINPDGLFSMKLITFAFFKSVLDDKAMDELNKYYTQQQSGVDVLITKKTQEHKAVTKKLQTNLVVTKRTLASARKELQKCKELTKATTTASGAPLRHWQVHPDASTAPKPPPVVAPPPAAPPAPPATTVV